MISLARAHIDHRLKAGGLLQPVRGIIDIGKRQYLQAMLLTEAEHVVELLHVPLVALGLKPRPVHIDLDMGHARQSLISDHAAVIWSARESRNIERAIDEGYVLDRFR
jgi:hypothetical protein